MIDFKILDVVNKIRRTREGDRETRIPLPLFLLTFENTEDIKRIYEIKYLCHMGVKVEAIKSNNIIPQCQRCQTQKFCQREPKCVRCAGNHITAKCEKPKNTAEKCSNCAEAHPANYRGCLVAKELKKKRNNLNKPAGLQMSHPTAPLSHQIRSDVSYAQIANPKNDGQSPTLDTNDPHTMLQMMQNIMNALNKLSERLVRVEDAKSIQLY